MSEHVLIVIPERAGAVPDPAAVQRAVALLEAEAARDSTGSSAYWTEIEAVQHDALEFVHCGENFESVRCPSCGEDLLDWWQSAMDGAYDGSAFRDLSCITPCCALKTTLHDLDYQWPQGFAAFELRVHDPNGPVDEALASRLTDALGMPLRLVYQML